ncbi:MAG: CRISPR-associated RAMP protein [Anaerolineales bacterium]|nr:CRISPR-associated RAMP protein [Anaerolineales bacterium]
MALPDMQRFTSRLHYRGRLVFTSAHRIGAERSLDVTAPDLPVLRTQDGRPYIPGSSLKGAWRSYTEAILRTVQGDGNKWLACLPIVRQEFDEERCLPQRRINELKEQYRQDQAGLDAVLRAQSCWTCRVFGNGQLASKLLIKDLMIETQSFYRSEIRDGVAIDRDSGRAADGFKYQFEAVPAGAAFGLEVVIENASAAELGLAMLGLRALERGDILLGGAKSRGLGWCKLNSLWEESEFVSPRNLLAYALRSPDTKPAGIDPAEIRSWLDAFEQEIEAGKAVHHA